MASWQSVTLTVSGGDATALGDALIAEGALCVDLSDADAGTAAEQAAYDEPSTHVSPWNRSCLTALFAEGVDTNSAVRAACHAAGVPVPEGIARSLLPEQDWVRRSQAQFKSVRISERLWIVPSWETPPSPHALNLRLDPGVAFGTGSHATTRLCLQWLERNLRRGESVLDYGCGSGILAIAAARLGAGRVIGVDIDANAVLAAHHNALQNRVDAQFFSPGSEPKLQYQVVVANILANPLIALAPLLAAATSPRGRIVLSGVLETQAQEVMHAYAAYCDMAVVGLDEGWALLAGERPSEAP